MLEKKYWILVMLFLSANPVKAQSVYGSTGLLRIPTANMQRDKTFMFGANMIDVNTLSHYWTRSEYHPHTFNYFVNVTILPWLEVAYTCTLVKGIHGSTYWPERTWGKFVNQDRAFSARLRLWKEGWWKEWTPQVVLGTVDPGSHSLNGGGDIDFGGGSSGNHNYLTRYYVAATKHLDFDRVGELGIHAAFVMGRAMGEEEFQGPAVGANFRFHLPESSFLNKAVNGLDLIAEYDACTINCGLKYSVWKDRINAVVELNEGRYWSTGIYFKVCLK